MATESPLKSDFDLDFRYGSQGEQLVNDLLTNGKTVEVKRDRKWVETGNIYVEYECWYNNSQSWELSGLSVSKASYWAFVLEESVMLVLRYHVDWACRMYGRPITCNLQPNNSRGFLITPEHLLMAAQELI
jgi:hypothetical protein